MPCRAPLAVLAAVLVTLAAASAPIALEKTAHRVDVENPRGDWRGAATTCSLIYYNTCNAWVWTWSGWGVGERYGVGFETCCGVSASLLDGWIYIWSPAPSGYGFTGTLEVCAADPNRCPTGSPIHSQPFLPAADWNYVQFGFASVPDAFTLTYTVPDALYGDPHAIATDFPASGGVGEPPACGTCYPTTRVTHSFYYGTTGSPLCPGQTFDDGTCDAELLWELRVACTVSVDDFSWGRVKSVFR